MKSLSLHQPHAIIMVGIPGSGKTFFASKFAETFGAPRIELDEISPLAENTDSAKLLSEQQLTQLLKTGVSIVLEVDSATRQSRTELARKVRAHNYVPLFIWVQTDPDTAKQRTARSKTKSAEEYKNGVQRFSAPHESEHALVISGKHTYPTQAKVVLKRLSAPRADISSHKQPVSRRGKNIVIR